MSKLSDLEFFTIVAKSGEAPAENSISRYGCDILRDDAKLVAQVSSTVMTIRGDQASGR
jgi:hypothetical protein